MFYHGNRDSYYNEVINAVSLLYAKNSEKGGGGGEGAHEVFTVSAISG